MNNLSIKIAHLKLLEKHLERPGTVVKIVVQGSLVIEVGYGSGPRLIARACWSKVLFWTFNL